MEILDPRLDVERVRQIVELLYHKDALLSEKVAWRLRRRQQPYPAEYPRFHGVKWEGEITCGHNPWLRARLVDNLIIGTDVWRQAPISAAFVIAAGLQHETRKNGLIAGAYRMDEVLFGCVVGIAVGWLVSVIWPLPEPPKQNTANG